MLTLRPSCSIVLSLSSASAKGNPGPLAGAKQWLLWGPHYFELAPAEQQMKSASEGEDADF